MSSYLLVSVFILGLGLGSYLYFVCVWYIVGVF